MNFMHGIMHAQEPTPTARVRNFFLEHRELFNVGQEWWNELEAEGGSTWYKPWTWGSDEVLTNLVPWVKRNRQQVWSMLYGSLDPNI